MTTIAIVRRCIHRLLASSPAFGLLPAARQKQIAQDSVRVAAYMADPHGLVSLEFRSPLLLPRSRGPASALSFKLAPTLTGGTTAFDELLRAVDFPNFVAELLHGVFNAIVDSTIRQMQAYAELVASVAASVGKFADDAISDQTARDMLVAEFPDLFCRRTAGRPGLAWRPEADPAAVLRLRAALGLREPEPDPRRLIAATRRRLARNRQQALATLVLMGINRIVVNDGKITAKISFAATPPVC